MKAASCSDSAGRVALCRRTCAERSASAQLRSRPQKQSGIHGVATVCPDIYSLKQFPFRQAASSTGGASSSLISCSEAPSGSIGKRSVPSLFLQLFLRLLPCIGLLSRLAPAHVKHTSNGHLRSVCLNRLPIQARLGRRGSCSWCTSRLF